MKYNQRSILTSFALVFVLSTSAQMSEDSIQQDQHRIVFEPTAFMDNFYVGAAFGAQMLFTEDADYLKFKDRVTPVFSLNAGKWISPYWGLNLGLQGYALNGFSTVNGLYLADPMDRNIWGNNDPVRNHVVIRPDGNYRHFLRYMHLNLEAQASALNLILGYDKARIWDVIPSIGVGYMHLFNYKGAPETNSISTSFGLMGTYKLNNDFDLNLKVHSTVLPDHFDGRLMGKNYESYASVSIGVRYYLKGRGFKRVKRADLNLPIIKVVKEIETVYEVVKQIDTVYVLQDTPTKKAKSIIAVTHLKFVFDSDEQIDDSQDENIAQLAELLKLNPDMKLHLIGHTCNLASHEHNIQVGLDRANSIKQKLLKKGVLPMQLSVESQSFDNPLVPNTNEVNRAQNRRVEMLVVN